MSTVRDAAWARSILGVGPHAGASDIKQAHRDLTQVWHPDRFATNERLRQKASDRLVEINAAYEILFALLPTDQEVMKPADDPGTARTLQPHRPTNGLGTMSPLALVPIAFVALAILVFVLSSDPLPDATFGLPDPRATAQFPAEPDTDIDNVMPPVSDRLLLSLGLGPDSTEISQTLSAVPLEKEESAMSYTIHVLFLNLAPDTVRAFRGYFATYNAFDEFLGTLFVEATDRLPPGGSAVVRVSHFISSSAGRGYGRLAYLELDDLTLVWWPSEILFSDGRRIRAARPTHDSLVVNRD